MCGNDASVLDSPPVIGTSATQCSSAGNYPITFSAGTDNNYTFTYLAGNLAVTKAPLTASANAVSKTYGDGNPALGVSYSGFVCGDNVSALDVAPVASTSAGTCSNTGSYQITLSAGSDNNYTFSYTNSTLVITRRTLFVQADNQSRQYGNPNPPLTVQYVSGFYCGDGPGVIDTPPVLTTSANTSSNVGTYPITVTNSPSDNNYIIVPSGATLTVNKADQAIVFDGLPNQCSPGGSVNINQYAYSTLGLPLSYTSSNGSVAYISGNYAVTQGAGYTQITAFQAGGANYNAAAPVSIWLGVSSGTGSLSVYPDVNICSTGYADIAVAQGGHSYMWSGDYFYPLDLYTIRVNEPGTFYVDYVDEYSCHVSASVNIIRESYDGWPCPNWGMRTRTPESISAGPVEAVSKELPEVDILTVFPNPANRQFTIAMPVVMDTDRPVLLYDTFGKVVRTGNIPKGEWKTDLTVSDLADGIYVVRVGTGALINATKVTIQHR